MEVGKLAHSHSQPGGMDRTPPGTPKKGGKMLAVRVQMLDDTVTMFQVQAKALGRVLFDQVCNQLNLLESDYFGLEYQETGGTKYWLDLEKPLCRQIGLSLVDTLVRFCVKFYTPDPSQLEEEFTRYLFCLQIKRDLSQGLLQCNSNTAALMASYIVQAECGDYVVEDYPDHQYLSSYKFVPNQDQELERRIMENHKKHAGQSPAEADLNLLETARRCELYGIKMHPAKDHEGCPLNLAVAHMGIVVFQNFSKINTFSWAKIRKISFKRKRFLVKLHPEGYGYYKDTVEFFFEGRNECKNFWKKCVENHGFFRCTMVKKVPRQKTRVLSRGSSFRYSGRTQKQIVDFVRENYVKRQTFQRSQSFRHSSSAHSSVANVGTSISAHPLLPLGDNAVAGTPASLSCGSMTLTSSPVHTADIHAGASPSPPLTTSVSPGTSVTSSPQHFYPQETSYRRAGHRLTKMKHPPAHSHRAISPLNPADAAMAASNRSANHSNNILIPDGSDVISSRNSLKSPEFVDFNDVYSNCYTSLRSLRNVADDKMIGEVAKTADIFGLPGDFSDAANKSNGSVGSLSQKAKFLFPVDDEVDVHKYTWHRSASCKELYHDTNVESESEKENTLLKVMEPSYASGVNHYDKSIRKCYSAVTSKNPSMDRTGDVGAGDMRMLSRSYPGIKSSLSMESSAEGKLDDGTVEVLNVKYDSQEEMALSHDDVSHDSYELLERELDDYNDEPSRTKRSRVIGDNERTRSCSWGSDKGISALDFRSSENVVESSKDKNFWSLEREKSLKHKSEIDFRSFNHRNSKGSRQEVYKFEEGIHDGAERRGKTPEFLDRDSRFRKRCREVNEEQFETVNKKNPLDKRAFGSKSFGDRELSKGMFQEIKLRRLSREDRENSEGFERKRHQCRRKSFEELGASAMGSPEFGKGVSGRMEEVRRAERRRDKREKEERFHEGLKEKEQIEWEREKERRQIDRRKSMEEYDSRGDKEPSRKVLLKSSDYTNFQEIHFKKFERVVSNQFGKYPEFSTSEETACEFLAEEKKVMENYEKMCQVSRIARELKKNENLGSENVFADKSQDRTNKLDINNFGQSSECQVWKKPVITSPKVGRVHVERTKSDPYNIVKLQKRNVLIHQKSIDLSSQQSEETASDYDYDEGLKKASRSEHDIPYILHKRHCMNGTAKNSNAIFTKSDLKANFEVAKAPKLSDNEAKNVKAKTEYKNSSVHDVAHNSKDFVSIKQRFSCVKVAEAKKAGVQIINLDAKNEKTHVNIPEPKKTGKIPRSPSSKKPSAVEIKPGSKTVPKKETKKIDNLPEQPLESFTEIKKEVANVEKNPKCVVDERVAETEENEEPIYAEVCLENNENDEYSMLPKRNVPPNPPKRISSISRSSSSELKVESKIVEKEKPVRKSPLSEKGEQQTKMSFGQKTDIFLQLEEADKEEPRTVDIFKGLKPSRGSEAAKFQVGSARGKQDLIFSNAIHHPRREESLILFARTRLGLSEGSAFAPIVRQGRMGSPLTQRRAKSLDAPYVSVHSLPPADAFSSKDDTVDGNESYIVDSAVARFEEFCKEESRKDRNVKKCDNEPGNTESEVDSVFTDDVDVDNNFKKTVENQSKIDISFPEERVLDGVRGKRLLSKIESVDFIDSEGDLDSSKLAESLPIPSDRLVNLPESIRFPSVRQISGQTSEESADGWDQREVKVKRRTPRRSVGREEQETQAKESVAWDSKDDEPPDDDVWDDNLATVGKYEGVVVNVGLPTEYLKRGSCGQSIDDDNLSTPMKESSPEHWVSVDDLPEALEREEKLLKQQEKLLREKILNEKLKRELNLDTIGVDERYCEYKNSLKQSHYDEESTSLKENLKGLSLDTYELYEKKSRERKGNKNSSLDEELLPNKLVSSLDAKEKSYIKLSSNYHKKADYIQCKVVKDVAEIDQFEDNDEELEEFFVVLDENLGKDRRSILWEDDETFRRTLSNDESLISVPEEFKDFEKENDNSGIEEKASFECGAGAVVEIRLNENKSGKSSDDEEPEDDLGKDDPLSDERKEGSWEEFKTGEGGDMGRLSPYGGSRRSSEENRKLSLSDDTGRLSPYDSSSRRSSADPKRFSASEDPRRLSASEDSRKCSVSESVSEETRRRLSSTEETRRKRASLTKQCSVGAESLSDEIVSGIQECSLSFEHDEKDVFEPEPTNVESSAEVVESSAVENKNYFGDFVRKKPQEQTNQGVEIPKVKHLEQEVSEEITEHKTPLESTSDTHLAPPTSERELSRETEDSVDYGEGDFKDIRETVKEKDISEGLICDYDDSTKLNTKRAQSSIEKSESSEADELRFIDDKRGSTPEILLGKSREAVAVSIVVVNEGLSVLNKINEKDRTTGKVLKTESLAKGAPTPDVGPGDKRHQKVSSKPKPLTPKPTDYAHRKLTKIVPEIKIKDKLSPPGENPNKEPANLHKNSLDSSQESDLDRLNDLTLVSRVQNQIARRNLSDAGKCLRREEIGGIVCAESGERKTSSEDDALLVSQITSSEEREKTDSSSCELKSSADEMGVREDVTWKEAKGEKMPGLKSAFESSKGKRQGNCAGRRDKKSPDQEKRDSGEDGSSSSSAPLYPKRELSSTWKPFLLESSGSSSLEEGWLPPDENAHLADEEETSSTSNNQQDDSCHDDVDYPTGVGYPVLNMASAEMMVGGYGSVYALSRTLSRISERSTSEQERSDIEDDITKPSSHSASIEEESIMSSDHQPSLSSDPPSPKESATLIPDLPIDKASFPVVFETVKKTVCEPFEDIIPPPLPEEDWPSPPSSFSTAADTPVVSHIETFYMEIHPEEACKIVVAEAHDDGNSSSDENQTLQEESEFLHLSSDNMSASTTTTTQDGTVVIPVRPSGGRTGSLSEDASMISTSEWSSSTTGKSRSNSNVCSNEDGSERTKNLSWQDWQISIRGPDSCQNETSNWPASPSKFCPEGFLDQDSPKLKIPAKIKPLKLSSPTGKTFGFFETPVSKVRSPTSQIKFFESKEKVSSGYSNLRSPTSFSESACPKNYGRFFEVSGNQILTKSESHERRTSRSPTKGKYDQRAICTPYYSNVTDSAEKSYFGQYDTGSLERTKIQSSRKCCSYYSVSKTAPNEGDSSNSDERPAPSPNTIPRASKKTRRRHRVAMDLVIRNGKIVIPPKTKTTVVENSDSDRSSPRERHFKESQPKKDVNETLADGKENNGAFLSSTPVQNGKVNGEIGKGDESETFKSSSLTPFRNRTNNSAEQSYVISDDSVSDQNSNELQTKALDPCPDRNTLDSKLTLDSNRNTVDGNQPETETKKKRYNADRGYFIMKELLSTERTYKKDLDVITVSFHEKVSKSEEEMPDDVLNGLFNLFEPLTAAHTQFLRDLEQCLAAWEGKSNSLLKKDTPRIGDVIVNHFSVLPLYTKYLDKHLLVLERLDAAFRKNKKFEKVYREFELQPVCYLPLSSFIMKPLQRLLHYNNLLKRLTKHYGSDHVDYNDFTWVQNKLESIIENVSSTLKITANFIRLSELQRDMPSFEGLLQGGREFIRQGCLLKHSKKGFQQRMFFLFSDILVYANRTTTPSLQFKVNGQMPLRGVMIEESEDRMGTDFSFTIYGGNRTLTVAASSQEEKEKWLQDLLEAVQNARERNDGKFLQYLSLKSCSSSDEIMDKIGEDGNPNRNQNSQQRSNTTVHVCWHRNTSTSLQDHLKAFENELSGFLLRKFKKSNGWQKLWVVFTNFCLFFYKAYLDEAPLACLPLLEYLVTVPDDEDDIRKDYVFKLQFKNHVYFFRAESDYTFSRWIEVISSATKYSSVTKLGL